MVWFLSKESWCNVVWFLEFNSYLPICADILVSVDPLQDDSYLDSYISTIGVDFVSI